MREENTERKYPKFEDRWDPEKERKHRRIRAGKKKKYFQSKSNWKPKVFCIPEMRQVMRRSSLREREKQRKEVGREKGREGIHLWARQIAQLPWKRAVTRHDSHNPPDCQTAL